MFGIRLSVAERYALRQLAKGDYRPPSTLARMFIRREIKKAIQSGELELPQHVIAELELLPNSGETR